MARKNSHGGTMKICQPISSINLSVNSILLLLALISPSITMAKPQYFLGIEPQVHQEDWYEKDELDINILPLVYERPFREHFGLRMRGNLYLHTGGSDGTAISLLGLGAAWQWYLDPISEHGLHGFNIGPAAIFSRDILDNFNHTTLALEVGYAFAIADSWILNVSSQIGRSFFSGNTHPDSPHFGVYVNFGRWFY